MTHVVTSLLWIFSPASTSLWSCSVNVQYAVHVYHILHVMYSTCNINWLTTSCSCVTPVIGFAHTIFFLDNRWWRGEDREQIISAFSDTQFSAQWHYKRVRYSYFHSSSMIYKSNFYTVLVSRANALEIKSKLQTFLKSGFSPEFSESAHFQQFSKIF